MKLKNLLCHLLSTIGLNTEETLLRVDSKFSMLGVMEIEERECSQKRRKTELKQGSDCHKIVIFCTREERESVCVCSSIYCSRGFPPGSVVKNPPAKAGDEGSIPASERSPGEGNGNPLQYSCMGNPMDTET